MGIIIKDLVGEYSVTEGDGAYYELNGTNINRHRIFDDVMADADTSIVTARMGNEFEIVRDSVFTAATQRLSRSGGSETILASSNGGAKVTWGVGIKEIYMGIPAELAELLNMKEIAVASASTCDIGSVQSGRIEITGTTTITSFGSAKNKLRFVKFSGALTLTHNGTSLILPGGANIVTADGDCAVFHSDNSGNWRCLGYTAAANSPIAASATHRGPVELATNAETLTGTDAVRAVTPAGLASTRIGFRAHKNGSGQGSIAPSTYTKITFGTEVFDIGGYYDNSTSVFTPPAGLHVFAISLYASAGIVDQQAVLAALYKNGAKIGEAFLQASGSVCAAFLTCIDQANGTDTYEVYFAANGAGNKTVDGDATRTFFSAAMIRQGS